MKITQIPFVKHVGIKKSNDNTLKLENKSTIKNHLGTIHAGAIFTLAETQSGLHLQQLFPEFEDKVIPLLRESSIKYKRPIKGNIYATASINIEDQVKFESTFLKKGRGSITISVILQDEEKTTCAVAKFNWFIQEI